MKLIEDKVAINWNSLEKEIEINNNTIDEFLNHYQVWLNKKVLMI